MVAAVSHVACACRGGSNVKSAGARAERFLRGCLKVAPRARPWPPRLSSTGGDTGRRRAQHAGAKQIRGYIGFVLTRLRPSCEHLFPDTLTTHRVENPNFR